MKRRQFKRQFNLRRFIKNSLLVVMLIPLTILSTYNNYHIPFYEMGKMCDLGKYTLTVDLDLENSRFICEIKKSKKYDGLMQFSCQTSYYSEDNNNFISFGNFEYFKYTTKSGNTIKFDNNMYYFNNDETIYISYEETPEEYKEEIVNRTDNVTLSILGVRYKVACFD